MATKFDFNSIADLGKFWDASANASNWGGGQFNQYPTGTPNINSNLDLLYQNLIGRNADPGGRDYWAKEIASGATTYQGVADAIKASNEYTDQQTAIAGGATANELKNLGSAYVSPYTQGSGSAVAGYKPGDSMTTAIADAVTTDPSTGGSYSDQTNTTVADLGGGGGTNTGTYDDSALLASISGLTSDLSGLKTAFDKYKTDMQNMWNNANWGQGGYGQAQTVGGVKTQNEIPGWAPKTGGTAGFFGRGGNRFGLSTKSLNI